MDNQLEERIIELETRLSYLERANDELSKVVAEQADITAKQGRQLREVLQYMKGEVVDKARGELPPHY